MCDLCIHLRKDRSQVKVDPDLHLRVFFGTNEFESKLEQEAASEARAVGPEQAKHFKPLWEDIANQLRCQPGDIVDFDLCFADGQPGTLVVAVHMTRESTKS